MGLDSVELIMRFEEAFGVAIPDATAERMITPRDTVDYFAEQLAAAPDEVCASQKTFYQLRRGLRSAVGPEPVLRPGTEIRDLVERCHWTVLWGRVRDRAGAADWPERVPWRGWMLGDAPRTLGQLVRYLLSVTPMPRHVATKGQIELIVRRIIREQLGVQHFSLDDEYVRDLGVD